MASRKPDLKLPIPPREVGKIPGSSSSLRSPRFTEDFDAPFSEAIMNASVTTLATTETSSPSTSQDSRTSFTAEIGRPSVTLRRSSFMRPKSCIYGPEVVASSAESKRRSNVNDRIREWARKSWGVVRGNSDDVDGYFDTIKARRKSSVVNGYSSGDVSPIEVDEHRRVDAHIPAAITEVPK